MRALTTRRMKVAPWERLGTVESDSEPGVEHAISRRTADGHVGCDCMSYRFRKGVKTCKHIEAWLHDTAGPRMHPPAATTRVSYAPERDETFTVRRAVSFGGL